MRESRVPPLRRLITNQETLMHFAAWLFLSTLSASSAASAVPTAGANVVEICSVALGTCRSLPAAALDPTRHPAAAAGQLAFVDPQSGALVEPTAEQAAELSEQLAMTEDQKVGTAAVIDTLPNGTVRARGDFRVFLRAELKPAAKPAAHAAATEQATSPEEKP